MPKKILVIWPPHVPSYFNAGHHSITFMIAGYLREQLPDTSVDTLDAGALNVTWKEIGDRLWRESYDHEAYQQAFRDDLRNASPTTMEMVVAKVENGRR